MPTPTPRSHRDPCDDPPSSLPPTSKHWYACEFVGNDVLVHGVNESQDDAVRDVVNRRRVGGSHRNYFVLSVLHVGDDV
jgi:hypothetical protein